MLILSRKRGEVVRIGENIQVVVLESHGAYVKLGFVAPQAVSVHREEIYQKIQASIQAKGLQCAMVE